MGIGGCGRIVWDFVVPEKASSLDAAAMRRAGHVDALADGGVLRLQPAVESLGRYGRGADVDSQTVVANRVKEVRYYLGRDALFPSVFVALIAQDCDSRPGGFEGEVGRNFGAGEGAPVRFQPSAGAEVFAVPNVGNQNGFPRKSGF